MPYPLPGTLHVPHTLRTAPLAPSTGGSSRQPDQKLYKAVWAVLRQAPLVRVAARVRWRPLAFLAQQLPVPGKSMGLQAAEVRAWEFVQQLDVDLAREIQAASVQVGWWSVRFASDRSRHPNKRSVLEASAILIIDGVRLANRVGLLVHGCLCGHLELGAPLPKAALMPLVHGIMLLKTIEASPSVRGCSPTHERLRPHALEAATPRIRGCDPTPRLPCTRNLAGWRARRRTRRTPSASGCASYCYLSSYGSSLPAGAATRRSTLQPLHPVCSPMHPACSSTYPGCSPSTQAAAPCTCA